MKMTEPAQFHPSLRGRLLRDEPMSTHVSWRAGGRARTAYVPADLVDLGSFLVSRPAGEAICFVGLGSNLLVRDGGFEGAVVLMHSTHGLMRAEADLVYAEASVANPKVARFAANHDFEAAEFLAGVPGTVGGALAMNAGCYGSETWDYVAQVQTIDRHGVLRTRRPEDYEIAYRHCVLRAGGKRNESATTTPHPAAVSIAGGPEEWFTAAWFQFRRGNRGRARNRIKELLAQRVATQPLNLPNAGSVFRNPPGDYAARLIEACGLKGRAVGGARVSEKHSNFIVNPGGAGTATDIEALIELVRAVVLERFGVALIPEVRIIGNPGGGRRP